jgi:DnaJ family protein A protein 2
VYDAGGGADGAQQQDQQQHGGFPPDIFSAFFGGMGVQMPSSPAGPAIGSTTIHKLQMTLEDIFTGKAFKLALQRTVVCETCKGIGGTSLVTCPCCKGAKVQTSVRHLGPGFIQHIEQPCPVCRGAGSTASCACTECSGARTVSKTDRIEVRVPPGSPDGFEIRRPGIGNAAPDVAPGDVVFVVQTTPHAVYSRRGSDLHIDKTLTLQQSLCGFQFHLKQIDGTAFTLRSIKGQIISPGTVCELDGLGMPALGGGRGRLFVTYHVEFPTSVLECSGLAEALPSLVESCR